MLILTRKKNESIFIGPDIEVIIVDIKGKSVKVGINAKKEVTVLRGELMKKLQEEMKKSIIEKRTTEEKNGSTDRNSL